MATEEPVTPKARFVSGGRVAFAFTPPAGASPADGVDLGSPAVSVTLEKEVERVRVEFVDEGGGAVQFSLDVADARRLGGVLAALASAGDAPAVP